MTKTIGVFFGSRNPEHDVSIITGQLIISGLRGLGYAVVPVYLDKKGSWYIGGQFGEMKHFTTGAEHESHDKAWLLDMEASAGKLVFRKKELFGKTVTVDVAFPAFHGQNGEDGTFQGLCEMLNVPYVGCDVASSAVTMDKVMTKQLYRAENIPTTDFIFFSKKQWISDKAEIMKKAKDTLGLPVIVKPARLGSSIGISKAKTDQELEFAIDVACHYDTKVIVETCVANLMDVTCCVIGNDELTPSRLQESVFGDEVFSYENKYLDDGGAQLGKSKNNIIIPARLDEKTTKDIQNTAMRAYKLIGCSGIARVDFLYDTKAQTYYANEVNTLPGTLYHHLWKASGVELPDLLSKLIAFAEEKYAEKEKITHVFQSDILKHAGSSKMKLKGA
jgi:D-alanine-D-alanine ligase